MTYHFTPFIAAAILALGLSACAASPTPTTTPTPTSSAAPTATAIPSSTPDSDDPGPTDSDRFSNATRTPSAPVPQLPPRQTGEYVGIMFTVGEGSEITFTVGEQLTTLPLPNDAVLRTSNLSGNIALDGGASSITVDLHSLRSDQTFRDRYVQRTMFPNDRFATLTIPSIERLPAGFAGGDEASAEVSGTLNIKGANVPTTFDVTARDDGTIVFILAKTTVTWAQLGLPAPSARSVVSIEEEINVEVLLAVTPD